MQHWIFISVFISSVYAGDKCYNCNGVPTQDDCPNIVECGDHESCYTRKVTQRNGRPIYESGCLSKKNCALLGQIAAAHGLGRKRDLTNCYECCSNGNSTVPCNRKLCGSSPVTEKQCYVCDDVVKPEDCSTVSTCDEDSECHTESYHHKITHDFRYRLGCFLKSSCKILEQMAQQLGQGRKRSSYFYCNRCCDSDYCNIGLCGLPKKTKPVITSRPNNTTLIPWQDGTNLVCRTDPSSNATIQWSFRGFDGSNTIPSHAVIRSGPDNVNVTLFPVQDGDFGEWICTATNSVGKTETSAFVSKKTGSG